jgi:hypothetical protein
MALLRAGFMRRRAMLQCGLPAPASHTAAMSPAGLACIGPALPCGLPSPASHATARRGLPVLAPPTPCAPLRHPARGRPTTCQLGSLDRGSNRHVMRPWMSRGPSSPRRLVSLPTAAVPARRVVALPSVASAVLLRRPRRCSLQPRWMGMGPANLPGPAADPLRVVLRRAQLASRAHRSWWSMSQTLGI